MIASEKSISSVRSKIVSIEDGGQTFRGYYRVNGGLLSLWTIGSDGYLIGPFAVALSAMQHEETARKVLQDYVDGLDGRRRPKRRHDRPWVVIL